MDAKWYSMLFASLLILFSFGWLWIVQEKKEGKNQEYDVSLRNVCSKLTTMFACMLWWLTGHCCAGLLLGCFWWLLGFVTYWLKSSLSSLCDIYVSQYGPGPVCLIVCQVKRVQNPQYTHTAYGNIDKVLFDCCTECFLNSSRTSLQCSHTYQGIPPTRNTNPACHRHTLVQPQHLQITSSVLISKLIIKS